VDEGLTGVLVAASSPTLRGSVGLLGIDVEPSGNLVPGSAPDRAIADLARRGARAAVVPTRSASGELIALNLTSDRPATPVPILLAPGRAEAWLEAAAGRRSEARILVRGQAATPKATSIVARTRGGRGPGIVLSVATSGWFSCAGERGAGVAAFLALARRIAARRGVLRHWLVATSGHELGSQALLRLLDGGALPSPDEVSDWLHIGPGLATRFWLPRGPRPRAQTFLLTPPDVADVLGGCMELPGLQGPVTSWSVGDVEILRRHGYRASTLFSTYPLHHTRADVEDRIAPELLAPLVRALSGALDALERSASRSEPPPRRRKRRPARA
jgi:hypothetical protein